MHASRSIVGTAIALSLLACTGAPSTSLTLVVTADPDVRARCARVELHVRGGSPAGETEMRETRDVTGGGWPLRAVIVPRGGDASRMLEVDVQALDAAGSPIARLAAAPSFVSGQARTVPMHFEASCLGVRCAEGETCTDAHCVPAPVDPVTTDAGPAMPDCMRATWIDEDGDGYGDPASMEMSCEPRPGSMDRGGDCNDECATCHPGGEEICDGARDEDCDGDVDERCECTIGELRLCPGTEQGPCAGGTQACVGGEWSDCLGRVDPTDETCNAIDDDCDGRIDDELRRSCGGGCHRTCQLGTWTECHDDDDDDRECNDD